MARNNAVYDFTIGDCFADLFVQVTYCVASSPLKLLRLKDKEWYRITVTQAKRQSK